MKEINFTSNQKLAAKHTKHEERRPRDVRMEEQRNSRTK